MAHRRTSRFGFLVACVAVLAVACTTAEIPKATDVDLRRAVQQRPSTTLVELERGRSLYLARCGGCHQIVPPKQLRAEKWPAQVAEMQQRARLKPEDSELVVLYLVTMADASGASGG